MVYCPHCMHPSEGSFCPQCGGPLEWKPAPGQLSAGAMLNGGGLHRYVTGKALGQGGFGITYIAVDPDTRQRVAVKECFPAKCVRRGRERPWREFFRAFSAACWRASSPRAAPSCARRG